MAFGLAALLDDIALLARTTAASIDDIAAASARTASKAAGVIIDDAAVTPQMVAGVRPERELPIIARIARGSLINKLFIILPLILLINAFIPQALSPILMLGGCYLCFEGAEKIFGHSHEQSQIEQGPDAEKKLVNGAIRTDLILSAEIMVISLNEVANLDFIITLGTLIIVAIFITAAIYGVVALLIKLDDIGLSLIKKGHSYGSILVKAMPIILTALSIIGTAAMLWVGGHLATSHFIHLPELHHNSIIQWLLETGASMILGIIIGSLIMGIFHLAKKIKGL